MLKFTSYGSKVLFHSQIGGLLGLDPIFLGLSQAKLGIVYLVVHAPENTIGEQIVPAMRDVKSSHSGGYSAIIGAMRS